MILSKVAVPNYPGSSERWLMSNSFSDILGILRRLKSSTAISGYPPLFMPYQDPGSWYLKSRHLSRSNLNSFSFILRLTTCDSVMLNPNISARILTVPSYPGSSECWLMFNSFSDILGIFRGLKSSTAISGY
ncbi:hypothetical protein LXL04_039204 [Taraxacum kok-saghyz]